MRELAAVGKEVADRNAGCGVEAWRIKKSHIEKADLHAFQCEIFYVLCLINIKNLSFLEKNYFTIIFTNFFLPRFTTSPSAPKESAL